jgi:hydroxymethylbilane synthase
MRRQRFLAACRPDLRIVDLRGNVPTRVGAVDDGRCDAVVLAVAGLRRLGLEGRITEELDPSVMLPAVAQGALALEVRGHDDLTRSLVAVLDDPATRAEVTAERACLHRLEAGCQAPVGALGRVLDGELHVRVGVASPQGIAAREVTGPAADAERLGVEVAEAVLAELGLPSLRGVAWAGSPPKRLEAR